ncbi:hypothetical protein DSO57_1002341 [Entomophthora muscae]|uniref:Uncharacterized protein n=1 Tax=Entomophthora muscae TaxID=34485 RepID=A0ACC2UHV7_9FUNG|nr:hypothetical protein DSO57_1002341 [Entomophthora muscae]
MNPQAHSDTAPYLFKGSLRNWIIKRFRDISIEAHEVLRPLKRISDAEVALQQEVNEKHIKCLECYLGEPPRKNFFKFLQPACAPGGLHINGLHC